MKLKNKWDFSRLKDVIKIYIRKNASYITWVFFHKKRHISPHIQQTKHCSQLTIKTL